MEELDFLRRLHFRAHNYAARRELVPRWKVVKMFPEGERYLVQCEGQELRVPSALRWRMFRYGWAARLERLSAEFGLGDPFSIGPSDTVIDIGANVGEFALAAAGLGARVHCFEGDPAVYECLLLNTESTGGIRAHCQVLWNSEEVLTFYSAPARADSSIFQPGKGAVPLKLPARPLDDVAAELRIGDVSLLKCDAEGAEPEVLEGAKKVLARTRAVAIDTGPERGGAETAGPVGELLQSLGFTVTHQTRVRRKITLATRD